MMSPLSVVILDLYGAGITTITAAKSKARYDLNSDGRADVTPWIGITEGFLFYDRDANGTLTDVNELSFIVDLEGATTSFTRTDGSTGTVGDDALAFKPGPPLPVSAVDPNALIPFSQGNLATVPSDFAATDMTFTSPFSASAEQFASAIAAFAGTTGISELSGSASMLDGVGSITIPSVLQER